MIFNLKCHLKVNLEMVYMMHKLPDPQQCLCHSFCTQPQQQMGCLSSELETQTVGTVSH